MVTGDSEPTLCSMKRVNGKRQCFNRGCDPNEQTERRFAPTSKRVRHGRAEA
jgi:hypothetical protein